MKRKLLPKDLQNDKEFELLAEVSHQELREFVVEQIRKEKYMIRIYSIYQVVVLAFFNIHSGKEIFNFDNRSEGKTYFYSRKK